MTSKNLPSKVGLLLRQEAGFGCCECGNPFIEYHHIIPWSVENHFRVEDMMCLCSEHHHQCTVGVKSELEQRNLKANPYNIKRKYVNGYLKFNPSKSAILLGSNKFIAKGTILKYDDNVLLSSVLDSEGYLYIDLRLFDSENTLILEIIKNQWKTGNYLSWDIRWNFQEIKISSQKYKVDLFISGKSKQKKYKDCISISGYFKYNNAIFEISPSEIKFNNISIKNIKFNGMHLQYNSQLQGFQIIDTYALKSPSTLQLGQSQEPDIYRLSRHRMG